MREVIGRLGDGHRRYEMDDGSAIEVAVSVDHESRSAIVDFAGTSPQRPGNFNAPLAVCTAAVLYVFRTLVNADFPLNEGCLRPARNPRRPWLDAEPGATGRGRRRQRRDLAVHRGRAIRRAWRARGLAGNDEQPHLRRRRPPVLRDDRGRIGRGSRLRWRLRRADAHDEFAPHGSGSAREPAPGAACASSAIAAAPAATGVTAAATDSCARIEFRAPMTVAVLSNHRRIAPFGLAGGKAGRDRSQPACARSGDTIVLASLRGRACRSGRRDRDRDAGRRRIRLEAVTAGTSSSASTCVRPMSGSPARFGLTVCTRLPPARWLTSQAWKPPGRSAGMPNIRFTIALLAMARRG